MSQGSKGFGEAIDLYPARRLSRPVASNPFNAYERIERQPLSRVGRIGDKELCRILPRDGGFDELDVADSKRSAYPAMTS